MEDDHLLRLAPMAGPLLPTGLESPDTGTFASVRVLGDCVGFRVWNTLVALTKKSRLGSTMTFKYPLSDGSKSL